MKNYPNAAYINNIWYTGRPIDRSAFKKQPKSISVIGIDTEAYTDGVCFMIATSDGCVFEYDDFPQCMFTRRHKNKTFVAYNLGYDMGHFIKWLPHEKIKELWAKDSCEYNGYKVKAIRKKFLRITRNKKDSITFYDMLNFYKGAGIDGSSSLEKVAENILGEHKLDIETKKFSRRYVKKHWDELAAYCVQDAVLVKRLADRIIKQFEEWGVYPRALYSTAYVTYQYFSRNTKYVTVKRFWDNNRMLLDYAMQAYNGGKFEVTRKGRDYYYEYDIVSAYPYEIANLIDISTARVVQRTDHDNSAVYAFIKCLIDIPTHIYSPIATKYGPVNIYPVGRFVKTITKNEYEYLVKLGCNIQIIDGYYLYTGSLTKPYNRKIMELFEYKKQYKKSGDKLLYHTIKILLNSLYGKFVQIVKMPEYWKTSTCWNPIYGAVITANTRLRVSEMQQKYPSVVAVHTDSIISHKKLDIPLGKELGDWDYETEGDGMILGSGIYQVGDITKCRGFHLTTPLLELCKCRRGRKRLYGHKSLSWREAAFRGVDTAMINRFIKDNKWLNVSFDKKRTWVNDYRTFSQALKRRVYSIPHLVDLLDSP